MRAIWEQYEVSYLHDTPRKKHISTTTQLPSSYRARVILPWIRFLSCSFFLCISRSPFLSVSLTHTHLKRSQTPTLPHTGSDQFAHKFAVFLSGARARARALLLSHSHKHTSQAIKYSTRTLTHRARVMQVRNRVFLRSRVLKNRYKRAECSCRTSRFQNLCVAQRVAQVECW